MVQQHREFATLTSRLAALAAVALLAALFAGSQAQSASLAGVSRQLASYQAHGDLVPVGGVKYRDHRALDQYGYHHFRFRYTGDFPRYRYLTFDEAYEGDDYYPPQPHYFSHRYNWYPPTATFRYADGPWYAW
jgi:hypothetical protein